MKRILVSAVAGVLLASPVSAQSLMPEPFTQREIGLEFMRPIFNDADDVDALTFASILSTRLPIGPVHLVADLPFARLSVDGESDSGIGNVMVGVEATRGKATLHGSLRLPTAGEDASVITGIFSDINRVEVWFPDTWSFTVAATMRDRRPNGHGVDLQLGAVYFNPEDADGELALDYGAQYIYRPQQLGVTVGLQGRAFVTQDEGDFGERTVHDLRVRLDYTSGRWRPAIGATIPFDEERRDAINGVLRLGVQVAI